ncbi:M20/M25/M40 family metallo-hydrolase [Patulibacter sp.]|uniref:M20/M25/M40 family metallo-hydrolase n=1 Tax=Patulibacter sp. TaxID=1912859 RepID=UPI00271839F8|nr:M20/M25/M40 family metallo-hydrolase [Patulibacter sp.]MDO9407679.1 M20/M25/M40 family metallo-hydrolase [Patulibacter sp.]
MFDAPAVPSAHDHERLRTTFADLCAVRSPSGGERRIADDVLGRLRRLGLRVEEDDTAPVLGGDAGNLLCRIPAAGGTAEDPDCGGTAPWVLLCAHLDTVPVGAVVRPACVDGVWRDAGGGVLGADNKATVAALLVLAEILALRPVGAAVELLLTVQEEPQLRGVTAMDHGVLRSRTGVVVDHPSPQGGLVVGAPGHVRFEAHLTGRAAHAGIAPEQGRSAVVAAARAVLALPAGRLPDGSTVNVGLVEGGAGAGVPGAPVVTNVVPAHARLVGEIRAPDDDALQRTVDACEAALHDAVHDPSGPVDLDLTLETRFRPYAHAASAPVVLAAEAALRSVGLTPRPFADAGGSDANVLNARGLPTVNLAGGNRGAHEAGEAVDDVDLGRTLDLLAAVVRGVAV